MPIRKLLLPLAGTRAGKAALETAMTVAHRFGARLLVLHVYPDAGNAAPLAGEGLSGPMIEELMAVSERDAAQRGAAARHMFTCFAERHGLAGTDAATFLSLAGREEDLVAHHARLADLAVVPHPEAGDDVSSSDALHAVLFESGRPVLIAPPLVPQAGAIGNRICVAWNGSAESAAAVQTALPWLQRAEAVRILHADEYQRNGPEASEVPAYLALHGIAAETHRFAPRERDVGAGLLAAAGEWGADLLVTGAYSQSRLRQLFLGGVTRHILEHAALPVLMNR